MQSKFREQLDEMEKRKNIRHELSCDFNKLRKTLEIGLEALGNGSVKPWHSSIGSKERFRALHG